MNSSPQARVGGPLAGRRRLGETIVATETPAKATLPQRATHEIKELLILTAYLYITLGAVIVVKTAVLHTAGIEFAPWGLAIVKALVLAKFILVGDAMKIGEGHTGPLIWPTLHKAFGFLLLLVILTIIEEAVVGLFHHRPLAGYLIMLLVLIPYFAFQVLDDALGKGRLVRMFFVEREPMAPK
jgi:hypothetical protein